MEQIFDAHFHLIPPHFPLIENQGFIPEYFSVKDYQNKLSNLQLNGIGGTIVSGSFQGYDQTYLKHTLSILPKTYVGIAQVPLDITEDELQELNDSRVRGIRFNLFRGMTQDVAKMIELSQKVYEKYNWHTELYLDSRQINNLRPFLSQLPKFSIDHLGMYELSDEDLKWLVEQGAYFKATGFGRIHFEPLESMKKIMTLSPDKLIFGTDFPGTRARRPFEISDLDLIKDNFSIEEKNKILFENALEFYRI